MEWDSEEEEEEKAKRGLFSSERCRCLRSHHNDYQARVISEAAESSQVKIRPGKLEEERQRRKNSRPTLKNALQTLGHSKVTKYCRWELRCLSKCLIPA